MQFVDNRFDKVNMVSGYGIKLEGDLLSKIHNVLKDNGTLIVSGNEPVLMSNKVIDKRSQQKKVSPTLSSINNRYRSLFLHHCF